MSASSRRAWRRSPGRTRWSTRRARDRCACRAAAIRFEDATFHYGREEGVIENLDLAIAPGEKVGLVGPSGAGKSTVMSLLLRLHDLEGGRILIDGQDIAAVTQDSLRRQIGVVTQDTSLLHRSIRDNIAYGRLDATDAEIERAARLAHAHDFIKTLEDHQGPARLRRPGRRARRQAVGRAAPARRHRPRHPQGRAHPGSRRGDLGPRFGDRGGDPGRAGDAHARARP